MKQNRLICLVLIYVVLGSSFVRIAPAQIPDSQKIEAPKGLQFRLREGEGKNVKNDVSEPAKISNLSETETSAIINRLPSMITETSDKTDFSVRPNSLPPPKAGKIIPIKFPTDERQNAPTTENSAALEVVRSSPNGSVSFAADLSVTFSQPMIAVSSQNKASETVPVNLTPEVKGKWRWLGTKTLMFDAAERFPMATKFSATIPAGTKSANGKVLQKDFSWTFETPPSKVETFISGGDIIRRDAILFAKFNQKINADAVLQKINVVASGQKIPLRLATQAEIAATERLSEEIKTALPDRWIAFRAADLFPPDSWVSVNFETGMPSAEGNLTSISPQNFGVKTFGSLKFEKSYCGYDVSEKICKPYEDLKVEFNNPLDEKSFDKSLVKIEPPIENAEISVYSDEISIDGCCKNPRTSYKVTVSSALKDRFGQTLGADLTTEFKIGARDADLSAEKDGDFITLDPFAKRTFTVYSTNHKSLNVKIYAVQPEDYEAFYNYNQGETNSSPVIGKLVSAKTIKLKAANDVGEETKIDLTPAMTNGVGHAILVVETPGAWADNKKIVVWVQATQIGVDAFADDQQLTVYTSDLKSGKPLGNVNLTTLKGLRGLTNENGIANLELPQTKDLGSRFLIARREKDSAILMNTDYSDEQPSWTRKTQNDALRWFVFDDRQMYRPGETVSIKGYLRRVVGGKLMDVGELADAASGLSYVLRDSRGNEISKGNAALNIFGAFDFQIKLPETINLGYQKLEFSADSQLDNKTFVHNFQVQEFRRPEFEVTAKAETAAPFYVGSSATVSVEAKYYSGGALSNAETNWKVTSTPTNYTPPNRDDFTFGQFVPWWRSYSESDDDQKTTENFKGTTDASGKHFLAMDFVSANPSRPYTISAEARVQDVNRQTFAGSANLLIHPAELYVGLRTEKTFVGKGDNFKVETITTDIDGKAVENAPVSILAELKDWQQIKGEWQNVTVDTQTCEIRSANVAVACNFTAKQGGTFTIKASVLDRKERRNESELTLWVAGAKTEPSRDVEKESVEMIPDKKDYAPGQTAEILVNAPFFPAEGVMTLRRNGIVKTERFTMNEASTVLRIPLEESFLPNLHVQVDLFGAAKRILFEDENDGKLPKRPAFASGELNLPISTASRKLNVAVEPLEKTLEPGGETSINVAVKDNNGNTAPNTEVAVVAVDESILALTNYRISNPLDAFYREIETGVSDYYSRGNILLGSFEDLILNTKDINLPIRATTSGYGYGSGNGNGDGSGTGGGGGGRRSPFARMEILTSLSRAPSTEPNQIKLRQNFNALAIFSPSVRTDANGKATVKINLPDNLTRYRITAVAVTNSKKFGISESAITARQSLMIRPSAPRFMNFGDAAELPVVLQNQTNNALTVDVAVRAENANLPDGNGKRITIAANDRAEIRFPVTAQKVGIARFQVGAVAGNFADAAEFEFPVWTPATSEAFATYGTTDQNGAIVQSVIAPEDVFPQFGGLEVTTSSTQLQELTDAFIYLQSYPFECSEQISSRILSVAALRDVLQAFDAKDMPTKAQIDAKMTSDIERLGKLQHSDGGFSFWSSKDKSIPYLTVHIAHAVARARQKGYNLPIGLTTNLLNYLKTIEGKMSNDYSLEARWAISAYALYVRDLFGDKDAAKARKLLQLATLEKLSPEASGWILAVLADDKDSSAEVEAIKLYLLNRATETANAAHFVTNYQDGEYVLLSSDRRADAVILEALLKAEPNNDLIPKLVRGLLANKIKGRWRNTQENAFVLLALDKYFQIYEKATPNFVAKVWFGQNFAGEQKFAGRTTDSNSINVPMPLLQQTKAAQNLVLDKQGDGRLYYRIGLKYAPKNLNSEAADYGFTVLRSYEAIDQADDVKQNTDGTWTIKSGVRVRVRLQMVAPSRRYHVALVDNLPAGLEIVNSNLAVSESEPEDEKMPVFDDPYYRSSWFEHQNLRDERAEVFASLLYAGVWNYSYVARATTPGSFVAPPAKAEEMYSPETFGRTKTDFVKVE